jgi:hypothetical protein
MPIQHAGPLNILQQPKAKMITNPFIQPIPDSSQNSPAPPGSPSVSFFRSKYFTTSLYILLFVIVFILAYLLFPYFSSRVHA